MAFSTAERYAPTTRDSRSVERGAAVLLRDVRFLSFPGLTSPGRRFRGAFQLRSGCLRMLPQEILQFSRADSCGADESFYAGLSRVLRDGVLAQKGAHHLSAGGPGAVRFRPPDSGVDSFQSFQLFVNTLPHAASFGGFRAITLKLRLSP
jgi:hypothetical protein